MSSFVALKEQGGRPVLVNADRILYIQDRVDHRAVIMLDGVVFYVSATSVEIFRLLEFQDNGPLPEGFDEKWDQVFGEST